jgi:hypothetical protein
MNICILKENKPNEFRTPLTPTDIKRLKKDILDTIFILSHLKIEFFQIVYFINQAAKNTLLKILIFFSLLKKCLRK